jgi:putative acetyltransferase
LEIRRSTDSDLNAILTVEHEAFHRDEVVRLTRDLLADPTAQPRVSLLAFENGDPVGHVLFTAVRVAGSAPDVSASILAPLAVVPESQKRGVGAALIAEGLRILTEDGVDLVFVLGHPSYYPRHGFEPAGRLGLEAPYPIPEIHADAWMVQALRPGILGTLRGKVACAKALDSPEHWRE